MNDTGCSVPAADVDRFATSYLTDPESGALDVFDAPAGQWSTPPAFASGGAGLVSTADDYLAFAEMLLFGGAPILSRPSVETMTSDQLTPEQKAVSGFLPDDFDARGWGLRRRCRDAPRSPRGAGRAVRVGRRARHDLAQRPVGATRHAAVDQRGVHLTSPRPPDIAVDFLTGAYAEISD